MKYLVFDTYSQALESEAEISRNLGYPKTGVNASTGEVDPSSITERWAVPQQISDGRWIIPSSNEQGIESEQGWFPQPDFGGEI
jgi:hypothetical protein